MKITITGTLFVNELPRKYKYMTISKNGDVRLWEEKPTLYHTDKWQYNFTNGVHYGEIEINNVEFDDILIKLDDEAAN